MAVGSIVAHEAVVRKTQFPRLVIPLSVVLTSLFNLGLNLVVAFVFILAFGVSPAWTWLLLTWSCSACSCITTAVSMIVSALYPRFRDVEIIWTVVSTALFYATPVLYPISVVSGRLRDFDRAEPAVADLRAGASGGSSPTIPPSRGRGSRPRAARFDSRSR